MSTKKKKIVGWRAWVIAGAYLMHNLLDYAPEGLPNYVPEELPSNDLPNQDTETPNGNPPLRKLTSQSPEVKAVCDVWEAIPPEELQDSSIQTDSLIITNIDDISTNKAISIYGKIPKANNFGVTMSDLFLKLHYAEEGDVLNININSEGGYLSGKNKIEKAMTDSHATTITYVDRYAASAAFHLFLKGDMGVAQHDAKFIAHGARRKVDGIYYVANAFNEGSKARRSIQASNYQLRLDLQKRSRKNGIQISSKCAKMLNSDDNIDVEIYAKDLPDFFSRVSVLDPPTETFALDLSKYELALSDNETVVAVSDDFKGNAAQKSQPVQPLSKAFDVTGDIIVFEGKQVILTEITPKKLPTLENTQ